MVAKDSEYISRLWLHPLDRKGFPSVVSGGWAASEGPCTYCWLADCQSCPVHDAISFQVSEHVAPWLLAVQPGLCPGVCALHAVAVEETAPNAVLDDVACLDSGVSRYSGDGISESLMCSACVQPWLGRGDHLGRRPVGVPWLPLLRTN